MRNINIEKKKILLIHLLRSTKLMQSVSHIFDLSCFDVKLEPTFYLIWSVARDHWFKYHKLITKEFLLAGITTTLELQPDLLLEEEKVNLESLINQIYAFNEDKLIPDYALNVAQSIIDSKKLPQIFDNVDFNDLPAWMQRADREYNSTRLTNIGSKVDIFDPSNYYLPESRKPTGVSFVDDILGGGVRGKETIGILGPSGGGKTTLSLQLLCEVMKSQRHAMFCSFEQNIQGDISTRIYSYLTHTHIRKFENGMPEETKQKLQVLSSITPYMHLYNHCDKSHGFGGVAEIAKNIYIEQEEGRKPEIIIIDWLLPMVERYMASKGIDSSQLRYHIRSAVDELVQLAIRYDTCVIIAHQLNTEAASRGPGSKPRWTDAAECKSFSWMLNYTLALGNKDENNCMWICGSKARNNANIEKIIQLEGEYCRFRNMDDSYTVDSRTGRGGFIPKDLARDSRMEYAEDST
jgi:hypothetical protein